jgi:hypothetical protein
VARCEDFPCCGHGRSGCDERAEFTSEFWMKAMSTMDEDAYERMCEEMDAQEG